MSQFQDQVGLGVATISQKFRQVLGSIKRRFGEAFIASLKCNHPRVLDEMEFNVSRRFPGCIGSIDCMHVRWGKCPKVHQAAYRGKEKVATIVLQVRSNWVSTNGTQFDLFYYILLQAIATHHPYCTHLFVGEPGASKNLNVLSRDHFVQDSLFGRHPAVGFKIGPYDFKQPYWLSDGIYPRSACFVRPIHEPKTDSEQRYVIICVSTPIALIHTLSAQIHTTPAGCQEGCGEAIWYCPGAVSNCTFWFK